MSPEELLARLAPVRLPVEFAAFTLRDALLIVALGILTGLILSPLLRAVTRPRPPQRPSVETELSRLRRLPREQRLAELVTLLRRADPEAEIDATVGRSLYDPRAEADVSALERAVISAGRVRRRR